MLLRKVFICVAAIMLAFLCSCSGGGNGQDETTTQGIVIDDGNEYLAEIIKDGEFKYSIIREAGEDETLISATAELKNAIKDIVGGMILTDTDYPASKQKSDTLEILVGNTNRTESVELMKNLKYNDYLITVKGNKVIIGSKSPETTMEAVKYFIANYLSKIENNSLTISSKDSVVHYHEYEVASAKLNGVSLSKYSFVTSANQTYYDKIALEEIRNAVIKKTGLVLPIITDAEKADYEIVIGSVDRKNTQTIYTDHFDDESFYTIKNDGNNILVAFGLNTNTITKGVEAFMENITNEGKFEEKNGTADVGNLVSTIYAVSDTHNCFAMLDSPYVFRKNVVNGIQNMLSKFGPVDVFMMGGDMVSDYPSWNSSGHWPYKNFLEYRQLVQTECAKATKDGKVLYVAGNHDYGQGELATDGPGTNGSYNSADYYTGIMENTCGKLPDSNKFEIVGTHTGQKYILAYFYEFNGIYYFNLSPDPDAERVYSVQSYAMNKDCLKWVDAKLKEIDPDGNKVIFFSCHYVISCRYSNGDYTYESEAYADLYPILKGHKNLVYLYGHVHTGTDNMCSDKSSEMIVNYNTDGKLAVGSGKADVLESNHDFIMAYMGAGRIDYNGDASWFNTDVVSGDGGLGYKNAVRTTATPKLGQSLYIKVYEDRIVFRYLNYGTYKGYATKDIVEPYTIYLAK